MLVFVMFAILACAPSPRNATPVAAAVHAPAAPTWRDALNDVDHRVGAALARADASPTDWAPLSAAASGLLHRARLTGDVRDLQRAEAMVDRAFSLAPPGGGPHMLRARLDSSLHRFDRVGASLDRAAAAIVVNQPTRAAIALARADLAFETGDYATAHALFAEAHTLDPSVGSAAGLAKQAWHTGDLDAADAWFEAAEDLMVADGEPRAWVHLQRGLIDLDRGALDGALAHYRDAGAELPGYWLVEEHIAEVYVRQGRAAEAEAMYRDVIARTGSPELMDALAALLHDARPGEATAWRARARLGHEERIAAFPEASWGHALGHYLDTDDQPLRAVDLAERNAALRPSGEALHLLARAYLHAGRIDDARAAFTRARATPWFDPDLTDTEHRLRES